MSDTSSPVWAVGLMSGTSLDGLDAALVRTNGVEVTERGPWLFQPFDGGMRAALRQAVRQEGDIPAIEREFTLKNIDLVKRLLDKAGMRPADVSVAGFHGQTILHRPREGKTWQIGDAALLAERTGINTVADFRSADVKAGGQGAPLVPLYHAALARELEHPLAVLNIGGIANVTWVGDDRLLPLEGGAGERKPEGSARAVGVAVSGDCKSPETEPLTARCLPDGRPLACSPPRGERFLLAFDTGPGNVLLNEWALRHAGKEYDEDGRLALAGRVDETALKHLLSHPYFTQPPPKSLDRHDFDDAFEVLDSLSAEDGAATLAAFTAEAAAEAQQYFPQKPRRWLAAGGGRHNPALMESLRARLKAEVSPVEAVGWEGDALEAQAFAYLAVRSMAGLPLSLPSTTGVSCAATGGVFYPASTAAARTNR